jgi:hypothetical protein
LAATTIELYNDLLQGINTAQAIDMLAADLNPRIVGTPIVDIPDMERIDQLEEESNNEWNVTAGVLTYGGRIYVPKDDLLRNKVVSLLHNNQESGSYTALKNRQVVVIGFPLARNGHHWTKRHCQM